MPKIRPYYLQPVRAPELDALRGIAMLWMAVYHFCFDLNHFGWLKANFYVDPVWTWQRTCILSLFLFTAGASQALASFNDVPPSRFWNRWTQIALSSLVVSAGSYAMFPQSFIYFGVLQAMAVMLLLARVLFIQAPNWSLLLVAGNLLCVPWLARAGHAIWPALAFLDNRTWNWMGLISHKPITEDYVPLAPWFAVMLMGLVAGRWLVDWRGHVMDHPLPRALRPLAWLGRHSLSFYILHQPILIGLLLLAGLVFIGTP